MAKRSNPRRQYPRMVRVNELLREVLAEAVERVDDDRLLDVTLTNVNCDPDLSSAVVSYDALAGPDADAEILEAFEEIRPRLQTAINRETRLKQTPRLTFTPDPVVRSAARIEAVLRGLKEGDAEEGQGEGSDPDGR